jgi:hypothetical protein
MLIVLYGLTVMGIITIGLLVHMFNRLPEWMISWPSALDGRYFSLVSWLQRQEIPLR